MMPWAQRTVPPPTLTGEATTSPGGEFRGKPGCRGDVGHGVHRAYFMEMHLADGTAMGAAFGVCQKTVDA